MRLLTHNQLACIKPGCQHHFPLDLVPTQVEQESTELNAQFVVNLLPKVDYAVLRAVATEKLGIMGMPEQLPFNLGAAPEHAELIALLHKVLLDTHVIAGKLVCGKCNREYPIQQGIPNMRLNEEEA